MPGGTIPGTIPGAIPGPIAGPAVIIKGMLPAEEDRGETRSQPSCVLLLHMHIPEFNKKAWLAYLLQINENMKLYEADTCFYMYLWDSHILM